MTEERTDGETLTLLRAACAPTSEAFPDLATHELDLRAMRTLGRVLTTDANIDARPPKPPRGGGLRVTRRVPRAAAIAVPAAVVVAVAVVLAVTLLGTSSSALAQKFPVFATASATPVRAALGVVQAPIRISSARAIHTPDGTGYVMASTHGRELCIAAPAGSLAELHSVRKAERHIAGSNHRFVGGCAPTAEAEHKGVVLMLPVRGRVELVVVLPTGASPPIVRSTSGTATTLEPNDGTVTSLVHAPAVLEYKVRGRQVSTTVERSAAKLTTLGATSER
jgi:hypothetical protein